jgi:acetyltransferase
MYLESFTNLPEFFAIVSQLTKEKPVFILKGGTSQQGHQASVSHTAALATNQVLLQAAAAQFGFVLVDTIEQLLSITSFLAQYHHLPENTLIMTNAGGPAVNTTDLLAATSVALAEWSATAKKDLTRLLPQIPAHNPLDLLGDAQADRFEVALTIAQRDPQIDSLIIILTQQAVTDLKAITHVLIKHRGKKVIFAALVGGSELEPYRRELQAAGLLTVEYPNEAVEQLGILALAKTRQYDHQSYQVLKKANRRTRQLQPFTQSHELDLPTPQPSLAETFFLLRENGFKLPEYTLITQRNLGDLKKLQYPLFAKTANLSLLHKKDEGGVYGVVHDRAEAEQAYQALQKVGNEVLFQELIDLDHELLLGAQLDPQFGWYLSVGMGGSYTNLLADRSFIFLPATSTALGQSWRQTKAFKAIRQEFPTALHQINQLLTNTQNLLLENPWVKSLEINPLVVNKKGVWAVDVKIGV